MEVAFTIAKGIDLERFFKEADSDPQVFVALTQLMETLFFEPAPRGGLKDLENGKEILNEFIALLQRRSPPDFRALYSLRNIELFVSDKKLAPPGSEGKLEIARELYEQAFCEDLVRQGLEDSKTRWMALQLIRERRITTLLPDVEQLFELDATSFVIDVLRELGDQRQLQLLLDSLPRLIDHKKRAAQPLSLTNVSGEEESKHAFEYAAIVKSMGRLATPQALAHLKIASHDYDPLVRAAACEGISSLPAELIDEELRRTIRVRMKDSPQYVADEARNAAIKIGLPIPRTNSGEGPTR